MFNSVWLHAEKYKLWLERVEDPGRAKCKLCQKTFDIANMGEAALTSHAKGAKHQGAMVARQACASNSITGFFKPQTATTLTPATTDTSSLKQGTIVVTRNETLRAEIIWALKVVSHSFAVFKEVLYVLKTFHIGEMMGGKEFP